MHIKIFYCFFVVMLVALPVHAAPRLNTTVGAVVFEGVNSFPHQGLLPTYIDSLGQPLSLDTRARLKGQISAYYTQRHFLPPDIELASHPDAEEVIVVKVSEPQIGEVHLRAHGADAAAIQQQAERITGKSGVTHAQIDTLVRDLERQLGLKLSSSVHRLEDEGANYFLLLEVVSQVRTQLTYSAEGSERLGRHMAGVEVEVDNPFRGVAQFYVSALHTLESGGYRNVGTGIIVPVSPRDYLYFDASFSRAVPQDYEDGDGYADVYRRQWARASWRHQLAETENINTSVSGRLVMRNYTREEGEETEVDERLRMAVVGLQTTLPGDDRTHRVWSTVRMGLDALGAARTGTQNWGDIDVGFRVLEAGYTLWQVLPVGFSTRVDIAGQYSGDHVPYSQRFSFGGSRFARAYEPGEFSGDSGAGAKVELRRGFNMGYGVRARLVPYTYYGLAKTIQNAYEEDDSGASAGLGLRLLAKDFSAYVEYGKPLTVASDYREDDPRLAGRVNVMF